MPQAIAAFRASHPGVEVTLAEGEPEEIAPRLRAGEFDLVLLFEFEGVGERLGAGMRRFELLDDPLHLALRRRPPARRARAARGSRTCARRPGSRPRPRAPAPATWSAPATPPASSRRVSFESDDYQTVQGLVAAGVGVALIPQLALSTVRDDIRVRALHPASPVRKVFAATPRAAAATPAVATMLDVLREPAGSAGAADGPDMEPPPGGGGGGSVSARVRQGVRPRLRGRGRGRRVPVRVAQRRHVGRVDLVPVDGDVALSISSSDIRSGTNRPTSLSRMNVPIAREDDHPGGRVAPAP